MKSSLKDSNNNSTKNILSLLKKADNGYKQNVAKSEHKDGYTIIRPTEYHMHPNNGMHKNSQACSCHPVMSHEDEATQDRVYEHDWKYEGHKKT